MLKNSRQSNRHFENRGHFELLIISSFFISLTRDALEFSANIEDFGLSVTVFDMIVYSLLSLGLGFLVSRLRSKIAAAFFLTLVALALFVIGTDLFQDRWKNLPFGIGLTSIIFDCMASFYILRWLFKKI